MQNNRSRFDQKKYRSSDSVSLGNNNVHELSEEMEQNQCYMESKEGRQNKFSTEVRQSVVSYGDSSE